MVQSQHSKDYLIDEIKELELELELLKTSNLSLSETIAMQTDIKRELDLKQFALNNFYKVN